MKTRTAPFLLITTAAFLAAVALFAQSTPPGKPVSPGPFVDPVRLQAVDADVVTLPAVTVESAAPSLTPSVVVTDKGAAALARSRHFNGDTERALNRVTLPVIGRSPEQRALARYREEKRLTELGTIQDRIAVVSLTDPAAAARLRDDLHSLALRSDSVVSLTLADRR